MANPPTLRKHQRNRAFVRVKGKNIYLGKWDEQGPSIEALAKYERFKAQYLDDQCFIPQSDPNIVQLSQAYLEHCRQEYADYDTGEVSNTYVIIKRACDFLINMFGDYQAGDFGIKEFYSLVRDLERKQLSISYLRSIVCYIKKMFKWAIEPGLIKPDQVKELELLTMPKPKKGGAKKVQPIQRVDRQTVSMTLPFMSKPVAQMVEIQLATGCRAEHVRHLRLCDIEYLDNGEALWTPCKDKSSHKRQRQAIPLSPKAQSIIQQASHREDGSLAHGHEYLFRPSHASHARGKTSELYRDSSYRRAITRACEKAGIPPWTPHQVRKLVCHEIGNRWGTDGIRAVIGHADSRMADYYSPDRCEAGLAIVKEMDQAG